MSSIRGVVLNLLALTVVGCERQPSGEDTSRTASADPCLQDVVDTVGWHELRVDSLGLLIRVPSMPDSTFDVSDEFGRRTVWTFGDTMFAHAAIADMTGVLGFPPGTEQRRACDESIDGKSAQLTAFVGMADRHVRTRGMRAEWPLGDRTFRVAVGGRPDLNESVLFAILRSTRFDQSLIPD